ASTKNSSNNSKIHIISATYYAWTDKLPNASLPEKGITLQLTLSAWPKGYAPSYIVFNNYKSISATVANNNGENVEIKARIIYSSGVLAKTSSNIETSDR